LRGVGVTHLGEFSPLSEWRGLPLALFIVGHGEGAASCLLRYVIAWAERLRPHEVGNAELWVGHDATAGLIVGHPDFEEAHTGDLVFRFRTTDGVVVWGMPRP
jgi:hypothetical protein